MIYPLPYSEKELIAELTPDTAHSDLVANPSTKEMGIFQETVLRVLPLIGAEDILHTLKDGVLRASQ